MGMFEIPLLLPVTRSVSSSISLRTSAKSTNFLPLQCRNSAHSVGPYMSWRISGRRVTMPEPRGKKSLAEIKKLWIELLSRLFSRRLLRNKRELLRCMEREQSKVFFSSFVFTAKSNWAMMSLRHLGWRVERPSERGVGSTFHLGKSLIVNQGNYSISLRLWLFFSFLHQHNHPLIIDFYSTNTSIAKIRIFLLFFSPFSTEGWILFLISLTCPRSSRARTICQPIVLPQQRFEANRFAYEHPSMWMHLGAC